MAVAGVVVKLGGDVLAGAALDAVAADLTAAAAGRAIVVVHGGGPQINQLAARLGQTPVVVGGRRVTDPEALDVVKMIVAGRLNVDLVAALRRAGASAVGLAGASGVVRAHRRPPRVVVGGGDAPIDFGLVGDVDGFDTRLLDLLRAGGYVPVVASLAIANDGTVLNINADVIASALATATAATALVAVTAVGGVRRDKDDSTTRLARLTAADARAAIATGVVQGGMIPKVEEALGALAAGVPAVHVVAPGQITAALDAPGSVGTLLTP